MEYAWIAGGGLLVAGGVLPSVMLVASSKPSTFATTCADAVFAVAATAFLYLGVAYQAILYPTTPRHVPFRATRRSTLPSYPAGFHPVYLTLAGLISLAAPCALYLYLVCTNAATSVNALLQPYLVVFCAQIGLETIEPLSIKRSCMAPVVPLLFFPYRLWQLLRGIASADDRVTHALAYALLFFWVFDSSALLMWLPSMYNAQLVPQVPA